MVCKDIRRAFARNIWQDLNLTIKNALATVSLASVMKRIGATDTSGDYCI